MRAMGAPLVAVVLIAAGVPPAAAQGFLEQFSYEGLGLRGIAVEAGVLASDRLTREVSPALRVDYGMIAPDIRVTLGVAYVRGDFNVAEIAKFEQRLRGVVRDPTGDFTIDVGTITLTDVALDMGLEYLFERDGRVTTYLGARAGVHVRNGSGAVIEGTFVEDALDTIAAGVGLSFGAEVAVARWLHVTADFRGGLTSGLRTASARSGLMLRFPGGG